MSLQPPATEVTEGPYDVRSLVAPRLSGAGLGLFAGLLSRMHGMMYPSMARQSGFPQVLSEKQYPEVPLYTSQPALDYPGSSDEADVLTLPEAEDAAARVAAAMQALGGDGAVLSAAPAASAGRATALDYASAYRAGRVMPSQVADRLLAFLDRTNADYKLMAACDPEVVRAQAAASTARFAAKAPLSVLDGVPFAVKDMMDCLPYTTTSGTSFLAAARPVTVELPAVTALKGLGAVCLGMTASQELGVYPYGINAVQGISRNPHNRGHLCGGSSTGSGGVVAMGLVPMAFGGDGGGSIRIPSALCGVVGIMPTSGRYGKTGIPAPEVTVATLGPIAGSVGDAALMYAAIANTEVAAPARGGPPALRLPRTLAPAGLAAGGKPLAGLRVGIFKEWFEAADAEVVAACRAAVERLAALGADVREDICIPEIFSNVLWAWRQPALRKQMGFDTQIAFQVAEHFTATDLMAAARIRARAAVHFARAFRRVDVLVTPATSCTAPAIPPGSEKTGINDLGLTAQLIRYTQPANLLGHPALVLPVGTDGGGLPIGLQLMGRPWQEATLFRAAAALEADLPRGCGGGDDGAPEGTAMGPVGLPAAFINPLVGEGQERV